MKLNIFLLALLSIMLQSCSMLPGSYNAGGYSASGYSSSRTPVVVELEKVSGNNLKLVIERLVFLKTLRAELEQKGRVLLGDSTMLKLNINIERNLVDAREYKTLQHGLVVYHLDQKYRTTTTYTITDKAGFTPVKGVVRYSVTVRAKSGVDYDDAKRVGIKSLFKAIAKRVANDLSSKSSILSSKYN